MACDSGSLPRDFMVSYLYIHDRENLKSRSVPSRVSSAVTAIL
jgi:hypothetical protein